MFALLQGVPLLWRWIALGIAMVAAAGFGAVKMHAYDQARYDALEVAYSQFKADVTAQGVIAQRLADAQTAKDQADKELADAQNLKSIAALHNTIASLRKSADANRQRSRSVPAAASNPSSPDKACFDRTKLESALRDYRASNLAAVRGFLDQGSDAIADLDSAKRWAQAP